MCVCVSLLGSKAHAETGQVPVGEGEEDHEDDVPGVMFKQHGEVVTRLHVAQHEEGDEDDPQTHQDRKPVAVLTRLQWNTVTWTSKLQMLTLEHDCGWFYLQVYNLGVNIWITMDPLVHAYVRAENFCFDMMGFAVFFLLLVQN